MIARRQAALVCCAFLLSRAVLFWLAVTPEVYRGGEGEMVTGDVDHYQDWAGALRNGQNPYSDVPIEYPPGVLPLIVAPGAARGIVGYHTAFAALALLIDAAALAGLAVLARRGGSTRGLWLWVAGVPLLGPLALLRLDLAPAAATIWALERASSRRPFAAGIWMGAGAVLKLYPALLIVPALAALRSGRLRLVAGAGLVVVATLLPFAGVLPALGDTVLGYHAARGLQVESSWAVPLLIAGALGAEVSVPFSFGAFHVQAAGADILEGIAVLGTGLALAAGTVLALRAAATRDDRGPSLADVLFTTLALLVATSSVFSPQYLLWLLALGGAALAVPTSPLRKTVLLLLPVAALTQLVYPLLYDPLLRLEPLPVGLLTARNAMLAGLAVTAAWRIRLSARRPGPARSESAPAAYPVPAAAESSPWPEGVGLG